MIQPAPRPISFPEALERTATSLRLLLLGNGFSISARPSFRYQSLFESAQPFSAAISKIFSELETQDFEQVLEVLRQEGRYSELDRSSHDAEVRAAFLRALSSVHPHSSVFMTKDEADRCASFLEHFVSRGRPLNLRGRVYTTNYDLLLYWVIARSGRRLWCYDSHISPMEDKRYGVWHPEKEPNLVYLHGALHLYDWGRGQGMLRYDGRRSLIDQIRERLDAGRFPVIVAEGTSPAKAERIKRSAYLTWACGYLRSGLRGANSVLFTYGHSLSGRDAHLLSLVGTGRIKAVYVGAYGGLEGDHGQVIHDWSLAWAEARAREGRAPPPQVWVYDTSTFSPWR